MYNQHHTPPTVSKPPIVSTVYSFTHLLSELLFATDDPPTFCPRKMIQWPERFPHTIYCKLLTVRDVHFEAVAWTSQLGFHLPCSNDCCLHHCCPNGYCRLPSSCHRRGCPNDDSRLGCCPIYCFVCRFRRNKLQLLFTTITFKRRLTVRELN